MTMDYRSLARHYESCLLAHGDTHRGVDWPNQDDANTRYRVMLEVTKGHRQPHVLDLGCGAAHLLDYVQRENLSLSYTGVDISPAFIELCRRKHPTAPFYCVDVLQDKIDAGPFDFVIMNGVFTEKRALSADDMFQFMSAMLKAAFDLTSVGLAFNVMSKHVDWERDDLFHVPFDRLTTFLCHNLSRHFMVRHDYGLYEYTTFVYRAPPR